MAKALWIMLVLTSTFSTAGYYWFMHRKKQRISIPVQWKQIGKVENIIMYPLKSGALRQLKEAQCTETGLIELNDEKFTFHDRIFVLYDKKLVPLKPVVHKRAVKIAVDSVSRDTVAFNAPSMDEFHLKLTTFMSTPRVVKLMACGCSMEVIDCGEDISLWMSRYILVADEGFRLGYYEENICRRRGAIEILRGDSPSLLSVYNPRQNDSGILADVASYLIVCRETVDDINSKLPIEDQFEVGNLRPNIVVSGCEKYAEDDWDWIKIGDDAIMKSFKPCTRCLRITIDPDSSQANKNLQPFKLLKTYRTVKHIKGYDIEGSSPVLGVYVGLYVPGIVKLGDPVYTNF